MKGVILAGGKGTRLYPLTKHVPKPMLSLLGKPVLEYTINLLKEYGVTDIMITLEYLPETVMTYFGNGEKWGVSIQYFIEEEPLGTAGSLSHLAHFLTEPFIVMSGDSITDLNLTEVMDFHRNHHGIMTMVTKEVENPFHYGVVICDGEGHVEKVIEKPKRHEVMSDRINTGIYILEPRALSYIQEGHKVDFSLDVIPTLLAASESIFAYYTNPYWVDIGQVSHYKKAHWDAMKRQQSDYVMIEDNVTIGEEVILIPPIYIAAHTEIQERAVVGPYAVVGPNCRIGTDSTVQYSILLGQNDVQKESHLHSVMIHFGDHARSTIKKSGEDGSPFTSSDDRQTLSRGEPLFSKGQMIKPLFQITSEFLMRLGQAFASLYTDGATMYIACDGERDSFHMKELVAHSLQLQGYEIKDLHSLSVPCLQHMVMTTQATFGLHVSTSQHEVKIEYYQGNGELLESSLEWQLEQAFWANDRLYSSNRVGYKEQALFDREGYVDSLVYSFHIPKILSVNAFIVVSCPSYMRDVLLQVCRDLRVECIHVAPSINDKEMSDMIAKQKAFLGINISSNGDEFVLFDETGRKLTEMEMLSLYVLSECMVKNNEEIPLPVHAPSTFDQVIKHFRCTSLRTKKEKRDIIRARAPIQFQTDALYALCQLLELIAVKNSFLSELLADLPVVHMLQEHIECPWEVQGKVLRKLSEEAFDKELIDGIKIFHDDGSWTLILPDSYAPILTIYSQATNQQIAEQSLSYFIEKIKEYQRV